MPNSAFAVFDPNIQNSSPAGSCLLKMIRGADESNSFEIFTARTDLENTFGVRIHKMPVPQKPVFLESICFTWAAVAFNLLSPFAKNATKISTQGGFPFCDVSYAHCCHRLFLAAYRSQISGDIITRTARLINHGWGAAMESIAFRRASIIVVPSQGLANELISAYGIAMAARLRVIPNPVDFESFAHGRPAANASAPFTFAFCALGNFEWKGLSLVLRAMASGAPGNLNVIGGAAVELDRFRKFADGLGVANRVNFVGFQKDIRPHLWNSNAFVFPSVYETFPLACLQAAAAGLPLIATSLYGLDQILEPGISGWRVERSVQSIQAAMIAAAVERDRTAELGRAAQVAASQYDTSIFQLRWRELLDELAQNRLP